MKFSTLHGYLHQCGIAYRFGGNTADLTSFKIGGIAHYIVYPHSVEQLVNILRILKETKFVVIGNGTNCYFTDDLYDGVVIVTSLINNICVDDNLIFSECGASVSFVNKFALDNSLSGLEFSYGIPGSVGGALCMNASAFGGQFSDVVYESTVYDIKNDKTLVIDNLQHEFGTKKSIFRRGDYVLLSTYLKLTKGEKQLICDKMQQYMLHRKNTQPLNLPSAGSAFVKPEDVSASKLIDLAGLKGFTVGGAQISQKHAGFIVNADNASSNDVNKLIDIVKKTIRNRYGIELEEEIIYLD